MTGSDTMPGSGFEYKKGKGENEMAKKLTAIILSALMLVIALAGCSSTPAGTPTPTTASTPTAANTAAPTTAAAEATATPEATVEPNETITLTAWMPDNQRKPYKDNLCAQWYQEATGIAVDMTTIPSNSWVEKRNVALAGGTYPDMFYMADLGVADMQLYGADSGYLIDLLPLINDGKAPNFKKFADADEAILKLTKLNGAVYALPWLSNGLNEPYFAINTTWIKNLGMQTPKTLDELTEVLRAFATKDPNGNGKKDEIAIASAGNVYWFEPLITCFGLPAAGVQEDANHKVFYGYTTQNFHDFMAWAASLYKEGIMDPRLPTTAINDEKVMADMQAGLVGCMYTANVNMFTGNPLEYYVLVPVPYGNNTAGVWPAGITLVPGTFAITDKCKNPDAALKWADFQYTEEATKLMWLGKEGYSYNMKGDVIEYITPSEYKTRSDFMNIWSIQGMHYYPGPYSYFESEHSSDPGMKLVIDGRKELVPITKKAICEYTLTPEETESISVISTDLANYVVSWEAKVIAGEISLESGWAEFQQKLKDMKLDEYLKVIQGAVDRYYAN